MTMHDHGALRTPARLASRLSTRPLVIAGYGAFFFGALPALLWAIGGRVDALLRLPRLEGAPRLASGAALAVAGAAFMAWSMVSLSRTGQGLPISHLPPTCLVARGPYAHMRHPIYVGYAAAFAGISLASGSVGRCTFSALLLVLGSIVYAVGFEEARLVRRFGAAYQDYAERVPAFPWPHAVLVAAASAWRSIRPAVTRLANRVVLFRFGRTVWVSYGAFAGAGAALGLGVCHALLRSVLPFRQEALYLVGLAVGVLVGARLVALLYQARLLLTSPREALRRVGFVSWGGYLGMFAAPFVLAPLAGEDAWWLLDRTLVAGLACSAVGRVGCLAYGCCYGRRAPAGICWHHEDAKVNRDHPGAERTARIPTQLLSTAYAAGLVPFALLVMTSAPPGVAAVLTSMVYCFARFGVECLRDEPRFFRFGLTRGQIVSAAAAVASVALLLAFPFVTASRAAPALPRVSIDGGPGRGIAEWGVVLAAAFFVFVACSVHWKRVGRW
jgi:protein-S-isoprenylcysteine O-methyltransferase Ste14/prolipoprotein diacylglyceryltransferase